MTTLMMNPDNLRQQISDLRDLAAGADLAKQSIDLRSNLEHDPLGGTEMSDFCMSAANAIADVNSRADDIELCMNKIIEVSESGVGTMDADGTIELELPDHVTIESSTSLVNWAQGVQDAVDIQQIQSGRATKTGRSYDEVIASVQANQENFVYADSFIEAVGPENLTSLPLENSVHAAQVADLLGTLLATASTGWTPDRSQEVADTIVESVDGDEEGEYGKITVLNAILGGHDANGDHVNDLSFGRGFLLRMADGLDEIDYTEAKSYSYVVQHGDTSVPVLIGPGLDPMEGVLDAMGNNPIAALDYLATASDSDEGGADTTVLETLAARDWDESGFAGFTAAVAAASSLRSSTTESVAARADQAAGVGIHELAAHTGDNEELYNDDAKARVALLLANCAPEVASAYGGGHSKDPTDPVESAPGGRPIPGANSDEIILLTYRVADNADAVATIGAALAEETSRATEHAMAEHPDDWASQVEAINEQYNQGIYSAGYLAGIADAKAEHLGEQAQANADQEVSNASIALTAFATVATGAIGSLGGPVGTVAGSAMGQATSSAVITIAAPVVAETLVGDAESGEAPMLDDQGRMYRAAALQHAANSGLMTQETLAEVDDVYSWVVKRSDGTYEIDFSNATDDDYKDMVDWQEELMGADAEKPLDSDLIESLEHDFNGYQLMGERDGRKYRGT